MTILLALEAHSPAIRNSVIGFPGNIPTISPTVYMSMMI